MGIVERYRRSHRYRKRRLAFLEIALIGSLPASVAACVLLSGGGLATQIALCLIYLSIPFAIYGYILIHSQFWVPYFARLRVSKSRDRLVLESPRLRWLILLGPWLLIVSAIFALTFLEPESMSRGADRPIFIRLFAGLSVILLLSFARSGNTVTIERGIVRGVAVWGPMNIVFRTEPIEAIEIGVKSGIVGSGSIERTWFGSRTRRAGFNPSLDLAILNNAYMPLELSDISSISGVEAKVGK